LASPGVADTYQGTELWELSLVDPDNRRPVDFASRVEWLRTLMADAARDRTALVSQLRERWMDGRIKLYVVARALVCRRDHAELFLRGDYVPLSVTGPQAHRACAFTRRDGAQWACIIVPRLCASLLTPTGALSFGQAWRDHAVTLPPEAPRCWRKVLTDRLVEASGQSPTLPLDRLVEELPVALLMSEA